jgi:8-oxo-(d)GTP phosphatase
MKSGHGVTNHEAEPVPVQTQREIGTMLVGDVVNRLAFTVLFVSSLLWASPGLAAETDTTLWTALGSGQHVAMVRHAIAPGTGDPPQFALRDCSTQRNLSNEGRDQAARIGARLHSNGITAARIFASQWCRCLETANLLGLGPVKELPMLNSFFQQAERANSQNQALKKWLAGQNLDSPLLLVTHQVNITAISGVYPTSGELVIMRRSVDGQLSTVGTIRTD